MMKQARHLRIIFAVSAIASLCACQTVKMPKLDILKTPEFKDDAENISTEYPDVADAPQAPTDIRSDEQWDKDVRTLQALKDDAGRVTMESGLTHAQTNAEYQALKAKVQAYKKDDPVTGPTALDFPDYKPRR